MKLTKSKLKELIQKELTEGMDLRREDLSFQTILAELNTIYIKLKDAQKGKSWGTGDETHEALKDLGGVLSVIEGRIRQDKRNA
jgi:hypothetical protein